MNDTKHARSTVPLFNRAISLHFFPCFVRDLMFHREHNQEPAFGIKSEKQQWVIEVVGRLDLLKELLE